MMLRRRAVAVMVFLAAEAAIRLSWLAGSRWGYTACDRRDLPPDPGGGCGADRVTAVPFGAGWGALLAVVALAGLVGWAWWRPARAAATALWVTAAVAAVAAFPLHLFFEISAALAGRPADLRDLLARVALVAGALLLARLALAVAPPRPARAAGYRPVPRWARRWAYAAAAAPVIGWAVPHGLWSLGVPFGIPAADLADIRHTMSPVMQVAITAVPPLAGLLALGLVQGWGQLFPRWIPVLGGRRVPPLLALVPAGGVALALVTYGGVSTATVLRSLADGSTRWTDLAEGWAITGTLFVFTGWGVALGVTAVGYHLATRGDEPPAPPSNGHGARHRPVDRGSMPRRGRWLPWEAPISAA